MSTEAAIFDPGALAEASDVGIPMHRTEPKSPALEAASQPVPLLKVSEETELLGKDTAAALPRQLSTEQLETIRMHFSEGHTLKEIAEIMGLSLVNVRNFYYRGLERIRKTILPAMTRSK